MTRTTVRSKMKVRKRGIGMKEMLKSKIMIGFVAFILGITYLNGVQTRKMEDTTKQPQDSYIAMDIK